MRFIRHGFRKCIYPEVGLFREDLYPKFGAFAPNLAAYFSKLKIQYSFDGTLSNLI
jgi:hypothetical protein